jgi:hypothetical protein
MTRARLSPVVGGRIAMVLAIALGACGKIKQDDPNAAAQARADAKRQQAACASSAAYRRLKDLLFDEAVRRNGGNGTNLNALADYSLVRMEDPVVEGWDPALDLTRCSGRFILEIPPGAERGLAGERRLQAEIDYTAQAAADGTGFVYELKSGEPIISKLASFNLTSVAYVPPPAIDERQAAPEVSPPAAAVRPTMPSPLNEVPTPYAPAAEESPKPPAREQQVAHERPRPRSVIETREPSPVGSSDESGAATVRAFYNALGSGNGAAASARIIPEKRSTRAFSPEAMSRFYGSLAEPIRLTAVAPTAGGAYRVTYRYSAGRSKCNGSAVVSLTSRAGRQFIRSIRALSGC